jgi:protein TonB
MNNRLVAGAIIVVLHVAAVIGLAHANGFSVATVASRAIEVSLLASETAAPAPPIPLVQVAAPTAVAMPPTEISLSVANDSPAPAANAITVPSTAEVTAKADVVTPREMSVVEYVQEPVPHYPVASRRQRAEGAVLLRVLVDESGRAKEIEIYRSSGHPPLDEAARDAVLRAVFKPYVENGVSRAAFVMIPIEFSLARRNS